MKKLIFGLLSFLAAVIGMIAVLTAALLSFDIFRRREESDTTGSSR